MSRRLHTLYRLLSTWQAQIVHEFEFEFEFKHNLFPKVDYTRLHRNRPLGAFHRLVGLVNTSLSKHKSSL